MKETLYSRNAAYETLRANRRMLYITGSHPGFKRQLPSTQIDLEMVYPDTRSTSLDKSENS